MQRNPERERERWRLQVRSSTEPQCGENPCGVHGLWRVEWGGTAGTESATSQPSGLLSSIAFTLGVGFASGSPADFGGLGVTSCGESSSRALHLHRFII